jgi:hypothetical protein
VASLIDHQQEAMFVPTTGGSVPASNQNQTSLKKHFVRLAYQPPASSTFLLEKTNHQQPANNIFLSEQTSSIFGFLQVVVVPLDLNIACSVSSSKVEPSKSAWLTLSWIGLRRKENL